MKKEAQVFWTVRQVSQRTGVSVRALHHYDAIGLLPPAKRTEAGYRLYDQRALERLQSILLFRELGFPLEEIKQILDDPAFRPEEALDQQIKLLELQAAHMEDLLSFARTIREKGVNTMDFKAFDKSELERYAQEVKARWGATDAYREFTEKTEGQSMEAQQETGREMMALFVTLGSMRDLPPADHRVQAQVAALQKFITDHYYHCTVEILQGLGQMYVEDPRMEASIDKAGGQGTADFASKAIAIYCENHR